MNVREFIEISQETHEPSDALPSYDSLTIMNLLDHATAAFAQAGVILPHDTYIGGIATSTAVGFASDGYNFQISLASEDDGAYVTRLSYFASYPKRAHYAESVDLLFKSEYGAPWPYLDAVDTVGEGVARSQKLPVEPFRMSNVGAMVLSSFIRSSVERGNFTKVPRNYLKRG